jgi:hypothetical protein
MRGQNITCKLLACTAFVTYCDAMITSHARESGLPEPFLPNSLQRNRNYSNTPMLLNTTAAEDQS